MKYDIITLTGQHSLIMPNLPTGLPMAQLEKKAEMEAKDISSFGLFDTATPNFSNYYPDVKAEDLNPEADKASFIFPIYRALSEVIVHKRFNPIDFGTNKALRNSMGMLKAQTVYPNHEMAVGNELGVVFEEAWQKEYTDVNGLKIPAGINVRLKLDGKSNPKIIRGILMDPPSIHSTSVTVEFGWEKSHTSMEDNEFWGKLGTYGADGQMVRRVVTEVKKYHEISLVPHGADPYAQLIKEDGNLNNPEYANKVYNSEKEQSAKRYFTFSYKDNLTKLAEVKEEEIDTPNNQITIMNKLIELAQKLGITTDGKDEATLGAEVSAAVSLKLAAAAEKDAVALKVTQLEQTIAGLTTDKTNLTNEKALLEKDAAIGKLAITSKREAVKTQLALLKDNNVDATLLSVIENADMTALTALEKDYEAQLNEKAPLHCEECSSQKVSRRTSTPEAPAEKKESQANNTAKPKSLSEAAKAIELSRKEDLFFMEKDAK